MVNEGKKTVQNCAIVAGAFAAAILGATQAQADICVVNRSGAELYTEIKNWDQQRNMYLEAGAQVCLAGRTSGEVVFAEGPELAYTCERQLQWDSTAVLMSFEEFIGCDWDRLTVVQLSNN